jgi:hypothetical protein
MMFMNDDVSTMWTPPEPGIVVPLFYCSESSRMNQRTLPGSRRELERLGKGEGSGGRQCQALRTLSPFVANNL